MSSGARCRIMCWKLTEKNNVEPKGTLVKGK